MAAQLQCPQTFWCHFPFRSILNGAGQLKILGQNGGPNKDERTETEGPKMQNHKSGAENA